MQRKSRLPGSPTYSRIILKGVCGLMVCLPSLGWAAADLLETSFETDEGVPYALETIDPAHRYRGWTVLGGTAQIIEGGEGVPAAPSGEQMLQIDSAGSAYLSNDFAVGGFPIPGRFFFSVLAAYEGSLPEKEVPIFMVMLNNWKKESGNFAGVHFGIMQEGGEARFFANMGAGLKAEYVTFGPIAQPLVFYRFEADVDGDNQQFALRVYEKASGKLLGEVKNGAFRSDRPTPDQGFNFLRFVSPDGIQTYLDDVRIGTGPVSPGVP